MTIWDELVLIFGVWNEDEEGKRTDVWAVDEGGVTTIDTIGAELGEMFNGAENVEIEIVGTKCCTLEDLVEASYNWWKRCYILWNCVQMYLSNYNRPYFWKGIEDCNFDW